MNSETLETTPSPIQSDAIAPSEQPIIDTSPLVNEPPPPKPPRRPILQRGWWREPWVIYVSLVGVLLLGFYFRYMNIYDWDSNSGQHPDERFFTDVTSGARLPESWDDYFNSAETKANPRNNGKGFFVYGTFPIHLTRLVAIMFTPRIGAADQDNPPAGIEARVPRLTWVIPWFNAEGNDLTDYYHIVHVGRTLALIFDLLTLILVFLIGRLLYSSRVGLLSAFFYALSVLPIQQSHFYVDPIFSNFFCVLGLYFAVRIVQRNKWYDYAFMGLAVGLAAANRVALAAMALMAGIAMLLHYLARESAAYREAREQGNTSYNPILSYTKRILLYGAPLVLIFVVFGFLSFRTFQPYSFVGATATSDCVRQDPQQTNSPCVQPEKEPSALDKLMAGHGFFDMRFEPRYLENIKSVSSMVSGEVDFPPSHQWVGRTKFLFPLQNIVVWGMGPLLGLAVCFVVLLMFGWVGWDFIRGRRGRLFTGPTVYSLAPFILWFWGVFYFAWQGGLFVTTMRYFLPIYAGFFILTAAWLIKRWNMHSELARPRWWQRAVNRWVPLTLVIATFLWAYGFTRIYTQPHSRVIAAQWALDNMPLGSRITSEQWDDALPIRWSDGRMAWGWLYEGVDTAPYAEDEEKKYLDPNDGLIYRLNQADYVTLNSNRVYDSALRMPARFPALTRYYQHLFDGSLGYELVAEVTSYPTILGVRLPDQWAEEAFSVYDHPRVLIFKKTPEFSIERAKQLITDGINWDEVYKYPLQKAEKAPTALRLTDSQYPRYRDGGTWSDFFNADSFINYPVIAPLLWLLVIELLGLATFALLFRLLPWLPDRGWSLSRPIGIALVSYAAWILGSFNLAAFSPKTLWLVTTPLLLIGAAVGWLLRDQLRVFWRERKRTILTAQTVYLCAFFLFLTIRWLNPDLWHPARGGEKPMEMAFLTATLKSSSFPPYDPWHAGGYINYYYYGFVLVGSLIHLTTIVPQVAYNLAIPTLFGLTALGAWGIVYNLLAPRDPSIERDLAPRFTDAGGFLSSQELPPTPRWPKIPRRVWGSALLAPVLVLLAGNLTDAIWYRDILPTQWPLAQEAWAKENNKEGDDRFKEDWAHFKEGLEHLTQYDKKGEKRWEWTFWDGTRFIPGTINEFPYFTFLFADMHAHMIVIPFSLAMLGLLVALLRTPLFAGFGSDSLPRPPPLPGERIWPRYWLSLGVILFLLGLFSGVLRATNTWDYPTFLGLTAVTIVLLAFRYVRPARNPDTNPAMAGLYDFLERVLVAVLAIAVVFGVGYILFLPFIKAFATESSGVRWWIDESRDSFLMKLAFGDRTKISDLLTQYGLALFVLSSAGIALAWRRRRILPVVTTTLVGVAFVSVVAALAAKAVGEAGGTMDPAQMPTLWTSPMLLVPLLFGALALAWVLRRAPLRLLMTMMWGLTGLAIILGTDLIVVKDDVGRMNTVFKFGLHAWILFGLSSAIAIPWLWDRLSARARKPWTLGLGVVWKAALVCLLLMSAVFPLAATPARIADRFQDCDPRDTECNIHDQFADCELHDRDCDLHTLDGLRFMKYAQYSERGYDFPLNDDLKAIRWLQANVQGSPVVLTAHQPAYQWASRVSYYTGLPTILGWEWHEIQQRGAAEASPIIDRRKHTVEEIYTGVAPKDTLEKLNAYGVRYVYVGGVERGFYHMGDRNVFDLLVDRGEMKKVYNEGSVAIYQVVNPGTPSMLTTDIKVKAPTMRTPPLLSLSKPVGSLPPVNDWAWNGLANSSSWVAFIVWVLILLLLTAAGLPIAVLLFGRWRDAGLAWAPLLGLLVTGWIVWIGASFSLWRYTALTVLLVLVAVFLLDLLIIRWMGRSEEAGYFFLRLGWQRFIQRLRDSRRGITFTSIVFFSVLVLFTAIRAFNPDLWEPFWGGEKPMGFGFLNAILRSPSMPPYDPFFSDGYINYYYYGLYLVSLPIKLSGITSAIGFNLAVATLAALFITGGYAIVTQLTGRERFGALGGLFLGILGNLGSVIPVSWIMGADGQGLGPVFQRLSEHGLAGLGAPLGTWYIGPSRIAEGTINEFPFWSFLFADLHPHLIALPITLLAIALAYQVLVRDRAELPAIEGWLPFRLTTSVPFWLITALTLGTLVATNSWDFPTYTGLILVALFGAAILRPADQQINPEVSRSLLPTVALQLVRIPVLGFLLVLGSMFLFAPFFDHFYALVSGIGEVKAGTPLTSYLVMYGQFLFIAVIGLLMVLWRAASLKRSIGFFTGLYQSLTLFALLVVVVLSFIFVNNTSLWLWALFFAIAMLLFQRNFRPQTWFTLALLGMAFAVSIGIDWVYIRDHLDGDDYYRMNTVFKFGMQIWTMLALASAAFIPIVLRGARRLGGKLGHSVMVGLLAVPVILGLVFPLIGTPNRISDRFDEDPNPPGPTLDGLAFMNSGRFTYDCQNYGGCSSEVTDSPIINLAPERAAIDWLTANVQGSPVVLQSPLYFYRGYGIRIAANTGFPTVISALHENEQRDDGVVSKRNDEIYQLYTTIDRQEALRLLAIYKVKYLVVGSVERAIYGAARLLKFDQMLRDGYLKIAYDKDNVRIYSVQNIPPMYTDPKPPAIEPPPPVDQPTPTPAEPSAELQEWIDRNALNPEDASTAFGLAERYRDNGQADRAVEILAVAAAANPDDVPLHHLWGDILTQLNRLDEAELAYRQAVQSSPIGGNWNKLGTGLLNAGKLDEAEKAFLEAAKDPTLTEPIYYLAQVSFLKGNNDAALDYIQRYLAAAPEGRFVDDAKRMQQRIQQQQ